MPSAPLQPFLNQLKAVANGTKVVFQDETFPAIEYLAHDALKAHFSKKSFSFYRYASMALTANKIEPGWNPEKRCPETRTVTTDYPCLNASLVALANLVFTAKKAQKEKGIANIQKQIYTKLPQLFKCILDGLAREEAEKPFKMLQEWDTQLSSIEVPLLTNYFSSVKLIEAEAMGEIRRPLKAVIHDLKNHFETQLAVEYTIAALTKHYLKKTKWEAFLNFLSFKLYQTWYPIRCCQRTLAERYIQKINETNDLVIALDKAEPQAKNGLLDRLLAEAEILALKMAYAEIFITDPTHKRDPDTHKKKRASIRINDALDAIHAIFQDQNYQAVLNTLRPKESVGSTLDDFTPNTIFTCLKNGNLKPKDYSDARRKVKAINQAVAKYEAIIGPATHLLRPK